MERVVNLTEIPLETREDGRAGLVRSQSVLEATSGQWQAYALRLSHTREGYTKPRQRQPFHQVRLQLKGSALFGRDGLLGPGHVAYLPAGVPYGPLRVEADSATLLLRFGEEAGLGTVSDFTPFAGSPDAGPDGEQPVFLDPDTVPWVDDASGPQVRHKALGQFAGGRVRVALLGLDEGTAVQLPPHACLFALQGAGRVTGSAWQQHGIVQTDDQPGHLTAVQASVLLQVELPPAG